MKKQSTAFTVMTALLVFSVSLFGNANAAPRLCDDGTRPPCDGGGGGTEPPDFGDLIILLRDVNGVPIPSPETQVEDPETGLLVDGGLCWQPVAFNVDDPTACPAECVVDTTDPATVSVSQLSCSITAGCEGCTQEVDFGRINSARAPDEVYDSQLADVVVNLATADCVTLDPAGRMVASRVVDGESLSGAIDSPIQNLAIYKQLMLTGDLGVPLPDGASVFDTAARGIGAGSDKGGLVDVDLVAYLNQIMGLSDRDTPTYIGKLCETYREEVQGVIQLVEKCFLNYGSDPSDVPPAGADYAYDRIANFSMLPNPAYIPPGDPEDGWFEYLAVSDVLNPDPDSTLPLFEIVYGPILETVFCTTPDEVTGLCDPDTAVIDPGYTDGNIGGFAQAADDTRAVIDFMHTWPVPGNYPTPVPCIASGDITYDVSISEESGLQVPVTYINGTEREFIVTVANAGPDPATGTVTVTAVTVTGASIPGSPWVFVFTDLAAGRSEAFVEPLLFDLGTSTTVNWTATAFAPNDVNPANNTVTAITSVRNTGGGQGGQGGRP